MRAFWHELRHILLRHKMCHMSAIFDEAVRFFSELEGDNSREFWQRERHRYDHIVKPTFLAVLGGIDGFGPWRVYRPHNDTRFGNAKGPYKTFIGAVAERSDGVGAFVQVSGRGVLAATGVPMPAPDQLAALRAAIADDRTGAEFVAAVDAARGRGATVHGGRWEPLRRPPRGHPADHPRAELLRWKGVEVNQRFVDPPWRTPEAAASEIDAALGAPHELHRWLTRHVGPSALTPEERFAPRRR
jgi:uncharacterized protein (DUF2461 family)